MKNKTRLLGLALAAGLALPAAAQPQDAKYDCQVGGVDVTFTKSGDTVNAVFQTGERYTLKRDASRFRPYYTDGRVAIRSSTGGEPLSTPSSDWVANGTATTITRCVPAR
jgi:hypothetical protein